MNGSGNRWTVRIVGIILVIVFALLMLNLEKQLLVLQKQRRPAAPATTT